MRELSIWQPLSNVQCVVNGGQLVFPSIRASPEDLVVVISIDIQVVHPELMLIRLKHLYNPNLIHSAHHMPNACRLLRTLFDKCRTRARSRRKDTKKTTKSRLPTLGGGAAEKISSGRHFKGIWISDQKVLAGGVNQQKFWCDLLRKA